MRVRAVSSNRLNGSNKSNKTRRGFLVKRSRTGGVRVEPVKRSPRSTLVGHSTEPHGEIVVPSFNDSEPVDRNVSDIPPRKDFMRESLVTHPREFCYFDIETGPLGKEKILEMMSEIKPAANLKDPVKIAADIEEKKQAFFDKAALSPTTGEVLAIGLIGIGSYSPDEIENGTTLFADDLGGEKKLLEKFWELWREGKRMVGFNCHTFDIPFLVRRSWVLSLNVPVELLGKWMPERVVDLLVIWRLGNRDQNISLGQLGKFFGVGEKTGDGAEFSRLYREDRAKAKEYLQSDILLTKRCAQKMGIGR